MVQNLVTLFLIFCQILKTSHTIPDLDTLTNLQTNCKKHPSESVASSGPRLYIFIIIAAVCLIFMSYTKCNDFFISYLVCSIPLFPNKAWGFSLNLSCIKLTIRKMNAINASKISNWPLDVFWISCRCFTSQTSPGQYWTLSLKKRG